MAKTLILGSMLGGTTGRSVNASVYNEDGETVAERSFPYEYPKCPVNGPTTAWEKKCSSATNRAWAEAKRWGESFK